MEGDVKPSIHAALAAAVRDVKAADKDGLNKFAGYKYASAEELIQVSREAMGAHGLALVCARADLALLEGCPARSDQAALAGLLHQDFLLIHQDGGEMVVGCPPWPVVLEKGRPIDKAVAGAITASLGYLLRGLLLIPRVDPADELDSDSRDRPPRDGKATFQPKARDRAREPARKIEDLPRMDEPRRPAHPPAPSQPPVKSQEPDPAAEKRIAVVGRARAILSRIDWPKGPEHTKRALGIILGVEKSQDLTPEACDDLLRRMEQTPDLGWVAILVAPAVTDDPHPSWAKTRAATCARLREQGETYEGIAKWCEGMGLPRPAHLPDAEREVLLRAAKKAKDEEATTITH